MSTGLFGAPGQHLDDAPDFAVPADDRVQLAVAGHFRQVLAIFLQGLELLLRGLVGNPLGTPEVRQGLEDGLGGEPLGLEQPADIGGLVRGQGPKQVLGGDVVVLHLAGLLQGLIQGFIDGGGKVDLGFAAHLRQPGQQVFRPLEELWEIDFQFLQEGHDEPLLGQEGPEQVGRLQLVVVQLPGQFLGPLQGLLGLIGQFVNGDQVFCLLL